MPEEFREFSVCSWGKNKVWERMKRTKIEIRSQSEATSVILRESGKVLLTFSCKLSSKQVLWDWM